MNSVARVHVAYIVGILLAIIVILVTVKWGSIPNLEQLLSFALTLASLLLAVLAIGYAIYSGGSLNNALAGLRGAADSLEGVAASIGTAAEKLVTRSEELPQLLGGMSRQVEETHSLVRTISEKAVTQVEVPAASTRPTDGEKFAKRGAFLGLVGLYAALRSYETKTAFAHSKIAEKAPLIKGSYTTGYLIASSVAGYLEAHLHQDVWTVTAFDDQLAAALRPEIDARLAKMEKAGKTVFGGLVPAIDAFFGKPTARPTA
jgi:hypothetical protein